MNFIESMLLVTASKKKLHFPGFIFLENRTALFYATIIFWNRLTVYLLPKPSYL